MKKRKRSYARLQFKEREDISRDLAQGISITSIAKQLKRSSSTVLREIRRVGRRNTTYRAEKGQKLSDQNKRTPRKIKSIPHNHQLRAYIIKSIKKDWSPEEISNLLKIKSPKDHTMRAAPETIYSYIYCLPRGALKQELIKHLRRERKARKQYTGQTEKRGSIINMISIDERPKRVEKRIIPGHWEGDLVVGKGNRSAIGTLVERVTRLTLIVRLKRKDAFSVRSAFEKKLEYLPKKLKLSLTYDRGKEMAEHELFTKNTKIQVFFAHPHHPWERGTNENTNGLIRQYFPKGTDFNKITLAEINRAQNLLNNRPRKVLDYHTPLEVFNELLK